MYIQNGSQSINTDDRRLNMSTAIRESNMLQALSILNSDLFDSAMLLLLQLPLEERLQIFHKFCPICGVLAVHCVAHAAERAKI